MGLNKKEAPKTPSERLRAVFYQHYNRDNQGFEEFDDYYKTKMELLIEHYKNKL